MPSVLKKSLSDKVLLSPLPGFLSLMPWPVRTLPPEIADCAAARRMVAQASLRPPYFRGWKISKYHVCFLKTS
jgi:hypothetical protein